MPYEVELKNMVTLVIESRKYNSGTYGDMISKELGMYDDFIFFSDIFLKSYILKRGLHKSGKLYAKITSEMTEENMFDYIENEVIRLNDDEVLVYMPHDKMWGVFTETDESCERLLNSLKKFKSEFTRAEAHHLIDFLCGKIRKWNKRDIEMLHNAAHRHLIK